MQVFPAIIIIVIILMLMTMIVVLSSWRGHCESSPGSFDECRLSARWPPTLRPSQTTWLVSPPVGCYHPHPPSPYISITQPDSSYSFYRPTEGGRLSRPRHCRKGAQPVPKAVHHVAVVINITGRGLSHRSQSCHR